MFNEIYKVSNTSELLIVEAFVIGTQRYKHIIKIKGEVYLINVHIYGRKTSFLVGISRTATFFNIIQILQVN